MCKRCFRVLYLLVLLLPVFALGQSVRPKVGLVLSGGAAKGLAHIPLLKTLDSLGIVPDYITGTSMGSIIGGLYAAGYSGDSLETLTTQLPWDDLLNDRIPFTDIAIEEQDEYGKYILELPFEGLIPRMPLGLVGGQRLEQVLARLTYPVSHITDFNKLPIPFNCVASDVVEGKPYVFKQGNLAQAMRASMAIPLFFTPVQLDSLLLVDGMMFSNLPVSYCRDMGADFIIGCDVGGGLFTKDELTSMPMVLYQAAILGSSADFEKQKADCDIFIDAYKYIRPGPLDFSRYPEILLAGDSAVQDAMPKLMHLADLLRANPGVPREPYHKPDVFVLRDLSTKGLSKSNQTLALGKFGLVPGDTLTFNSIENGIADMYGTRLFSKVGYQLLPVNNTQADLVIVVEEARPSTGKFALHFDTERGAGLILNYTARNMLGNGSRIVMSADLAETPRARLNYYRYLDAKSKHWLFVQGYFERQVQNTFIGTGALGNLTETYANGEVHIRYDFNRVTYTGLGFQYEHTRLKPKVNPIDLAARGPKEIEAYTYDRFSAVFQFKRNTFDKVFYPTKGLNLFFESKWMFANLHDAQYLLTDADGTSSELKITDPINPYLRLHLRVQQLWKLSPRWSWLVRAELGTTIETGAFEPGVSYRENAQGDFFQVGGPWQRPRTWVTPFFGLREQELIVPQYLLLGFGAQYSPVKDLYLIPVVNVLGAANNDDWLRSIGNTNFTRGPLPDATWGRSGAGISIAYHSILGPLQFTYARTFETGQVRAFLNLGYTF
ncbi:MAG: patatin-like phospholipase family protein [Saprospiraceae bacterium]